MHAKGPSHRRGMLVGLTIATAVSILVPVLPVAAVETGPRIPVIAPGSAYRQTNLISDIQGLALTQDPLLVNPWGIATRATSPFWIANDGTSTSTLYRGDVTTPLVPNASPAFVTIPGGLPTGSVANSTSDFVITKNSTSAPALFVWASITGNIVGWSPSVPPGSTSGVIAASHPGHVYTGLALANNGSANFLYAADFANGTIDVFDSAFALQASASFPFADPTIPTTAGNTYHPHNIQNIGGSMYVTYAKVGSDGRPEDGVGNGYVRRFNTNGVRDLTFGINNGALNSPWGITIAPASFGIFGGALLVGNFGDGNPSIHAFNPTTGAFLGTLQDEGGDGIVIDRLWGLSFGNGGSGGNTNTLYFTAGIGEEEHGLFGSLKPTTSSATSTIQFATDEYVIDEGQPSIQITVTRNGNATNAGTVRYTTWDQSQAGHASQKSDYESQSGVLWFGPGVTSRQFTVPVVNDRFVEGDETIDLALSNPTGLGVGLGSQSQAELVVQDNDSTPTTFNPIDGSPFFARQLYLDLRDREPTTTYITSVSNTINSCGSTMSCRNAKRLLIADQILESSESIATWGLIYRLYRQSFRTDPLYGEVMFSAEVQRTLGTNYMTQTLMGSPRFVDKFNALSNSAFVNAIIANSGATISTTTKNSWITGLNNHTLSRATVMLRLARSTTYVALVRKRWLVLMGFWAFYRRDPDRAAFQARLNELWAGGGNMITSGVMAKFIGPKPAGVVFWPGLEYRQRFGPQ